MSAFCVKAADENVEYLWSRRFYCFWCVVLMLISIAEGRGFRGWWSGDGWRHYHARSGKTYQSSLPCYLHYYVVVWNIGLRRLTARQGSLIHHCWLDKDGHQIRELLYYFPLFEKYYSNVSVYKGRLQEYINNQIFDYFEPNVYMWSADSYKEEDSSKQCSRFLNCIS